MIRYLPMSSSNNDYNPNVAPKLPSNSLNSNDVILNVEGRKRMRRPYERYMRQMMQQTAQKAVNGSKPQVSIYAAKINKSRSSNNAKFLSVISIFCAAFLLAVFAFNYLLSKKSQITLETNSTAVAENTVAANQMKIAAAKPDFIPKSIETPNETQNAYRQIDTMTVKMSLSESDFKQEAQNTLFRDSEENRGHLLTIKANHRPDTTIQQDISQEEFGVEAKNILYREEDISEAYKLAE